MNCKNCGHSTDGRFCSYCGQNTNVSRINLSNFLNEVSESVFQVNKGFFYTLTGLFVRPGTSLKEFLNGKRKAHFKPVAYVLTLSTIYFLIIKITDQSTWIDDIVTGWINHENKINTNVKIPETITWFLTNYAYSALLLLPVFSLASYLSFLKFGKNFLEHIVIGSYIKGQQAALYSLFAIGKTFIEGDAMDIFAYLIATLYTFWVFWQFFSKGNRAINILRSILTHILYFIFGVGVLIVLFETNIVK